MPVAMPMGIFSNCQVVLEFGTSIRFKEKKALRTDVTDNGGVISYIITKKSSYVVAVGISNAEDTYKCRTAQKLGIPIVSAKFIQDSIEAGRLLDHDGYLMAGKTRAEEFKTGKITGKTVTKLTQKKKLIVNVSNIKVWNSNDNSAPDFNHEKFQVAKFAVFMVPPKDQKSQKFGKQASKKEDPEACDVYSVELHADPEAQDNQMKYRIFTSYGPHSLTERKNLSRYTNSTDEALAVYSSVYKEYPWKKPFKGRPPGHIGSSKLKQAFCERSVGGVQLDSHISKMVSYLWTEAMGELGDIVSLPLSSIGNEKVEKGESLLKELLTALDKGKPQDELQRLSDEFYVEISHHPQHRELLNTKKLLAKKQDLCQLIRDMYAVAEATNWSHRCSPDAQYNALNCEIELLTEKSEKQKIHDLLQESVVPGQPVPSFRVFTVVRPLEDQNFSSNIHNKELLFHASGVHNFVGILSRGLLPPKVIVEDFGGTRSDIGMLGSGIYFSNSTTTSLKYSPPSKTLHSRMMVVSEVALGDVYKTRKYDTELKAPPNGYHSVHGVSKRHGSQSQFVDDEFVIYDTKQQRIKYLVEFWLPEDGYLPGYQFDQPGVEDIDSADDDQVTGIDLKDVQNVKNPLDDVALGLVSKSDAKVHLKSVHVRAQLIDLAAKVVVLQDYHNDSPEPIEAKYVFPLDEMAAVCGFEAFINGKHIVGEVKEKETAHREYKKAIAEGHGAYLMDQDEETPEIFTVSVGNLPPHARVLIKITYVAELQVEEEKINFVIPGSVAPWKKDKALGEITQTTHDTFNVDEETGDVSIQVSVEMPFAIRSIESPTHKVAIKRTETKAVVVMMENQSIGSSFLLQISLAEIHVPRMWVERHPDKNLDDKQYEASMLTFYPEFETEENPSFEVVFLLDCSNSMDRSSSLEARKILLLALHHLSDQCCFNVVKFGTGFDELFPSSQMKTKQNIKLAENFLQNVTNLGNTDAYKPLFSYFLLPPVDTVRNIFLISDGHVTNSDTTLASLRNNFKHTRLFTLGVSASANRHMLRSLAQAGAGFFEYFDSKMKSKWEGKIIAQLHKASQPVLTSVSIEWKQHDKHRRYCMQAPAKVTSLFNGSRLVVYGFVQDCTQATLTAIVDGREVSTIVSTSELSISSGKILHQLTARAAIRDWETGLLDDNRTEHEVIKRNRKSYIIDLSKEYSIVTQFTSFVAIEKREKDDEIHDPDAHLFELVDIEGVDILEYMEYEGEYQQNGRWRSVICREGGWGSDSESESDFGSESESDSGSESESDSGSSDEDYAELDADESEKMIEESQLEYECDEERALAVERELLSTRVMMEKEEKPNEEMELIEESQLEYECDEETALAMKRELLERELQKFTMEYKYDEERALTMERELQLEQMSYALQPVTSVYADMGSDELYEDVISLPSDVVADTGEDADVELETCARVAESESDEDMGFGCIDEDSAPAMQAMSMPMMAIYTRVARHRDEEYGIQEAEREVSYAEPEEPEMAKERESFSVSADRGDSFAKRFNLIRLRGGPDSELDEVKAVMQQNIESVLERSNKLDDLIAKSVDLASTSAKFSASAKVRHDISLADEAPQIKLQSAAKSYRGGFSEFQAPPPPPPPGASSRGGPPQPPSPPPPQRPPKPPPPPLAGFAVDGQFMAGPPPPLPLRIGSIPPRPGSVFAQKPKPSEAAKPPSPPPEAARDRGRPTPRGMAGVMVGMGQKSQPAELTSGSSSAQLDDVVEPATVKRRAKIKTHSPVAAMAFKPGKNLALRSSLLEEVRGAPVLHGLPKARKQRDVLMTDEWKTAEETVEVAALRLGHKFKQKVHGGLPEWDSDDDTSEQELYDEVVKDIFDTNPYASQDSEGYFSDTAIPSILLNKKMKKLTAAEIEELVDSSSSVLYPEEMFWDFSDPDVYERLLGVSVEACRRLLQDAGLQSLGANAVLEITRLVATLIAIYHIVHSLTDWVIKKKCLLKEGYVECGQGDTLKALQLGRTFCQAKERDFPLAYSTLELGSSWDNVIQKWLEII